MVKQDTFDTPEMSLEVLTHIFRPKMQERFEKKAYFEWDSLAGMMVINPVQKLRYLIGKFNEDNMTREDLLDIANLSMILWNIMGWERRSR